MKYCQNSYNCPYGNAFIPNCCAYKIDIDDFICPLILQDYEIEIDKLYNNQKKSKSNSDYEHWIYDWDNNSMGAIMNH